MEQQQRSRRRVPPAVTRSRLALELASELVGINGWSYPRAHIQLRQQDFETEGFGIFGSASTDGLQLVEERKVGLAMINPSSVLTMAYLGAGPFARPHSVRTIAVIPDQDQITIAVAESTGLRSFDDIARQQYPLRVSVRGPHGNSVPIVANEILKAHGFTLEDIESWGGEVSYDRRLPAARMIAVEQGETDAIFDEAVRGWVERAAALGMRFLHVGDAAMDRLRQVGLRPGVIKRDSYPDIPMDVAAVDFSGFAVYTHADVPNEEVTAICQALEARKGNIPWEGDGPLPLERMCFPTPEGPLDVPLHPAAETFWRERGYLNER